MHPNTVQRRSDLLADALRDRVGAAYHSLTEPAPAFRVAKPEDVQVREYLALVNSGQLPTIRESMGGPYDDAEVDRYVAHMDRLVPKHAMKLSGAEPVEEMY
jgi:predicted Zn-dependent protease